MVDGYKRILIYIKPKDLKKMRTSASDLEAKLYDFINGEIEAWDEIDDMNSIREMI